VLVGCQFFFYGFLFCSYVCLFGVGRRDFFGFRYVACDCYIACDCYVAVRGGVGF